MPNFIEIEETYCGRRDVRMHGRTFETGFIIIIRSTLSKTRPKKVAVTSANTLFAIFQILSLQTWQYH